MPKTPRAARPAPDPTPAPDPDREAALVAAALAGDTGDPEALHQKCPRCGSDTCPGRGDAMDCTAVIAGLTAAQELAQANEAAEAAIAATQAKAPLAKLPADRPTAAERAAQAAAKAQEQAREAVDVPRPELVARERASLDGWARIKLLGEAKRLTGADFRGGDDDALRDQIAEARVERRLTYEEDAARRRAATMAALGRP